MESQLKIPPVCNIKRLLVPWEVLNCKRGGPRGVTSYISLYLYFSLDPADEYKHKVERKMITNKQIDKYNTAAIEAL